ncbi:hypothetical protein BD289DRAFT_38149 [Coniella lustricola]|uniref:BAH domain-containing protein n=1 Tax=Coniella lustricola TaxID=2025994 RepID=A0A2T3AIR8_9PEZI|nr:hypothetical protein BD289DRAFT_38149 [Coniella lustricola]
MASARKRPRDPALDEANRAECRFFARRVDPKERDSKKKRRRKDEGSEGENTKFPMQLSPFAPAGKFKTHENLDIPYAVEPSRGWHEMTRYNSFVLNGSKYFSDNYIYVANENTVRRQKAGSTASSSGRQTHSDDDWVARILEIRASDEHHVYARIYWMYWPDELPEGTVDGKKLVSGRQPYHGQNELIASNHMDIINVVSVTQQATVNQVTDENDDQIQSALYWRQGLDLRTLELSSVDRICKCNEPGNPDKMLVACPNTSCGKWMHEECLKDAVLLKVWNELGANKPYKAKECASDKQADSAKRPLSPDEPTSATVAAQLPIQVKTESDNKETKKSGTQDSVDAKDASATQSAAGQASNGRGGSATAKSTAGKTTGHNKRGKKGNNSAARPYKGRFEATFKPEIDKYEIEDLRKGVEGGQKTWLEEVHCLCCGTRMD